MRNRIEETVSLYGYEPIENRTILVSLEGEFYGFQLCKNEVVLVNLEEDKVLNALQNLNDEKQFLTVIPYMEISKTKIEVSGIDYEIEIHSSKKFVFLAQAKISGFRKSGWYAGLMSISQNMDNWHKENLERTLDAINNIN